MCITVVSGALRPVLWFGRMNEQKEVCLSTVHCPPSEGRGPVHGARPGSRDSPSPAGWVSRGGLGQADGAPAQGSRPRRSGPSRGGMGRMPHQGRRRDHGARCCCGAALPSAGTRGSDSGLTLNIRSRKGTNQPPVGQDQRSTSAVSPTERQPRGTQPSPLPTPALWWPKA